MATATKPAMTDWTRSPLAISMRSRSRAAARCGLMLLACLAGLLLPSLARAQDLPADAPSPRLIPEAPVPGHELQLQLDLDRRLYLARAMRNVGIVMTVAGVGLAVGGIVQLYTYRPSPSHCPGGLEGFGCALGSAIGEGLGQGVAVGALFTFAVALGVPGIVMTAVGETRVRRTLELMRADSFRVTLAPAPDGAVGGGLAMRF
jgi:hypothetical protein